jgi:2-oxoglutarate dehydrogenase E2 component (dihydrolipoamide succinyltransferase)
MIVEIKVPSPGESITEVQIARWLKKEGDVVEKDDELCEIDSDKATLTVNAEEAGQISILAKEGDTVKVGDIVCKIDTSVAPSPKAEKTETAAPTAKVVESAKASPAPTPVADSKNDSYAKGTPAPAAKKLMEENKIPANVISGTGKDGRITKGDVLDLMAKGFKPSSKEEITRDTDRQKMSSLRKKLAQRLVAVKNETAMLTTFNEVDMSAIMAIRAKYKDAFKEKYGVNVGFMSFFTKAVTEALQLFPAVNAMIDGEEIVYHKYCDIGIAVSAPKGLVVPVLRNAEAMSLADIENGISYRFKTFGNKLLVYLDQNKIFEMDYEGELGEVLGIEFLCKGNGGVDHYSLQSNSDSTKREGQDF